MYVLTIDLGIGNRNTNVVRNHKSTLHSSISFYSMTFKSNVRAKLRKLINAVAYLCTKFFRTLISFNWINILLLAFSATIAFMVFKQIKINTRFDAGSSLSNLLTINGVFSAILITYLFTLVTWTKERKHEKYNDAINISQKITEFRHILNKLTTLFGVWRSDQETKNLFDHGKFEHIDYYDFRLFSVDNSESRDAKLIEELILHNENYKDGISDLYLAMVSLVKDRKRNSYWQPELNKDLVDKSIYTLKDIQRWIDCDIAGKISFCLSNDANQIDYRSLKKENDYILKAAARIDKKYENYELGNELIRKISDDFSDHYLKELQSCLIYLKNGIQNLILLITIIITFSLVVGVLTPFILSILEINQHWYSGAVNLTVALNVGLISFFILKFPLLISKELRWV